MYASMQLADAYDTTYACSRSMEASKQYMESCNASCSRSDQQIHETCRQAADHSNSAMEALASATYPAAADHSNSAMELRRRLVAAIQQQQIIATVL